MISTYTLIAYLIWTTMFIVWILGRIGNKRTLERPNISKYLFTTGLLYLSYVLLFLPFFSKSTAIQLTPRSSLFGLLGDVLCFFGAGLAVWARFTLGKNWSGVTATRKEHHELIQNGPYRLVRHPIYTGFLLGMLGFALTVGTLVAYSAVLLGLAALLLRIVIEEKLMDEIFPSSYKEYANRVKRLIPFVW